MHVKDISIDGMSFATRVDISKESIFNLSLEVSVEGEPPVRIKTPSKIIWCALNKKTSLYNAGVQFLSLNEAQRESLQDILVSLKPISP